MIPVTCPHFGVSYFVGSELAEKTWPCPSSCKEPIAIPRLPQPIGLSGLGAGPKHPGQDGERFPSLPRAAESYNRLHEAGWVIGDRCQPQPDGSDTWLVTGYNGENRIRVEAETQREAWWRACQQAEAVGMLRKP